MNLSKKLKVFSRAKVRLSCFVRRSFSYVSVFSTLGKLTDLENKF